MTEAKAAVVNRPVWVDLSTSDAGAARDFYSQLFGWQIDVAADPQYGGYGVAQIDGKDAAGIGPAMQPGAPTAWSVYIGTTDADALGRQVAAAGGTVIAPAFDVGDQGRMAVFQDPTGAFISAWQPNTMAGFEATGPGAFAWAELSARGMDRAVAFYGSVFGWTPKSNDMGEGNPPYIEFQLGGESVAGGMEMMPNMPAEVPSYWLAYFGVADVDAAFAKALELGARQIVAPVDFTGGRFAVVSDPQGATFGLLSMPPQ